MDNQNEPAPIRAWLAVLAIIVLMIMSGILLMFLGDEYGKITHCAGKCSTDNASSVIK